MEEPLWPRWCALWVGLPKLHNVNHSTTPDDHVSTLRVRSAWGHAALIGGGVAIGYFGLLPATTALYHHQPVEVAWVGLFSRLVLVILVGHAVCAALESTVMVAYYRRTTAPIMARIEQNSRELRHAEAASENTAFVIPGRGQAAPPIRPAATVPTPALTPLKTTAAPPTTSAATSAATPTAGRITRTPRHAAPQPEEIRDALRLIFNAPYEHLYVAALSTQSGSSPEDLHALGAAWIMAVKRLDAGEVREVVTPVDTLPPFGSFYDHTAREPYGVDLTKS